MKNQHREKIYHQAVKKQKTFKPKTLKTHIRTNKNVQVSFPLKTHTHTSLTRTGHQKRNMRPVSHYKTGRDLLDQKH